MSTRITRKYEMQQNTIVSPYALIIRELNNNNGLITWIKGITAIADDADGLDEVQTDIVTVMAGYDSPELVTCNVIYVPVGSDPPIELIMRIERIWNTSNWLMNITNVNRLTGERTVYAPATDIFIDLLNTAMTETFLAQCDVGDDYVLTSMLLDATFVSV